MTQRFVTSVDKTMWNGQAQVNSLSGVDEDNVPFTVSAAQASKQMRMEKFLYFLWDGNEKFIQLMSVANYVEASEHDDELNFNTL